MARVTSRSYLDRLASPIVIVASSMSSRLKDALLKLSVAASLASKMLRKSLVMSLHLLQE